MCAIPILSRVPMEKLMKLLLVAVMTIGLAACATQSPDTGRGGGGGVTRQEMSALPPVSHHGGERVHTVNETGSEDLHSISGDDALSFLKGGVHIAAHLPWYVIF